jgi:hypothetical protein
VPNPLVGTWRLVSFELRSADGKVHYPFGEKVSGHIIYSEDGFMSVTMSAANRPRCAAKDLRLATMEEKSAAINTYVSYSGRYEIQGDRVLHHVEVSLFPNWVGITHERLVELNDGKLSLTMPPISILGVDHTGRMVWERVRTAAEGEHR